uniref:vitrin isoform X3 n=1 Tax=Doryrhamphus excisus TaxID=161450 RepID=UPI0025AD9DAF|nr:vitrin isoform X3 [Doryrhamphus excisus]
MSSSARAGVKKKNSPGGILTHLRGDVKLVVRKDINIGDAGIRWITSTHREHSKDIWPTEPTHPIMMRTWVTAIYLVLLLSCASQAKPNGSKSKKPKQVIPAIECDVRAGKISLPEFIVKCPAHCRETKQQVYGTGVFASISSICNAAIHSGIITNSGGKVIVRKMAGQNIYKGSNSNGVRSLSLPKWRESFVVTEGKPKKGVIYPSTLDFVPSRPTYVKTSQKDKAPAVITALPPTTPAPDPTTTVTTPEPTTIAATTTTQAPTTTTTPLTPPPTTVKARAVVHRVRDAGLRRAEAVPAVRRQSASPVGPALNRGQATQQERSPVLSQSNPVLPRRDWGPPSFPRPEWFPGARRSSDVIYAAPDSGYTWSDSDNPEVTAQDHRPDISDFERWYYNIGSYLSRAADLEGNRQAPLDTTHTRVETVDTWRPDANLYESGFNVREQAPAPRAPEPVSQGDPDCKVDLVFLMDGSWSIGKRRFKIQKDFLAEVAQVINIGVAGPMMGVIQYGDDPVTEISLKSHSNSRDVKTSIAKIVQKGGLSNVGKALSYINKFYFSDANGNRGGAPNVAVVLVDGWPTDKVEEASRLARESGINIFFVTIEGPDDNEKQNLVEANFVDKAVCRTNGFFSMPVSSWFALRKAMQPLVKRVCDTDRLVCSKTCLNANDIAFVIDGSSSVGTGNFRTVLQFVANITREFEISDTDTRVGAVQYTYEQRLEFAFGQHNNKAELLNAIKRIDYWSGGTSTGAAITYTAEQLFSKSKPNKRKIMIVITDGRSYDDVRVPALAVHSQGVIAYSIGIAWAAQDELEYIATDPDKEHSFFVDEFDNLYKFVPKIVQNICQEFNSQPRN